MFNKHGYKCSLCVLERKTKYKNTFKSAESPDSGGNHILKQTPESATVIFFLNLSNAIS